MGALELGATGATPLRSEALADTGDHVYSPSPKKSTWRCLPIFVAICGLCRWLDGWPLASPSTQLRQASAKPSSKDVERAKERWPPRRALGDWPGVTDAAHADPMSRASEGEGIGPQKAAN